MFHLRAQAQPLEEDPIAIYRKKFEELGVNQALLESVQLAPEEYERVYGHCKALQEIRTVDITQKWQLQALRGLVEPDFLEELDSNQAGYAHYAALAGHLEPLDFIKMHKPQLLDNLADRFSCEYSYSTLYNYAIRSGDTRVLDWVKTQTPHLFVKISEDIWSDLAHAAELGWLQVLDWLFINQPKALSMRSPSGCFFMNSAVSAGRIEVLDWVKTNIPEMLTDSKNNFQTNIAHDAAMSGDAKMLDWVLMHTPQLLDLVDKKVRTFAYYAKSVDTLDWIVNHRPEHLDYINPLIAHRAVELNACDVLSWIVKHAPKLLEVRTSHVPEVNNGSIAHMAAAYNFPEPLEWMAVHAPNLLMSLDNEDRNIAHSAAYSYLSVGFEVWDWFSKRLPQVLTAKDKDGRTIFHHAAREGKEKLIVYFFTKLPHLIPEIWVKDKNGDTPNAVATPYMDSSPEQILNSLLLKATEQLAQGIETPEDIALIIPFRDHWERLLLKNSAYVTRELLARVPTLEPSLKKILNNLAKKKELRELNFEGQLLSRIDLVKLIGLITNMEAEGQQFFTNPEDLPLVARLRKFIDKLEGNAVLSASQIYCLQVIFEDYERGLIRGGDTLSNILIAKLRASKTLSQLRPNAAFTAELDIKKSNFSDHQATFSSRVGALPLNEEVKRAMSEVILPGLDHLIDQEEELVAHVTTKFGVLYWLVKDKLPLHTDHTPVSDGEAYRQTLHRLVMNFFGAAELCHSKGRLDEFCGKISVGYCLEGRIRDTFEWAISLENIVSFDEAMDKFVSHECLPYALVMNGISPDNIYIEHAVKFIIDRHNNALCLHHDVYAPRGKITRDGVTNYIQEILSFESTPLVLEIDAEIAKYRRKIEGRLVFGKDVKHLKIEALIDLRTVVVEEKMASITPVDYLWRKYPALRAGKFLEKVEALFEKEPASRRILGL